MKRYILGVSIGIALATASLPAHAETAVIAVAANFTAASKDIATAFTKATGHTVKLSFGSTGKIYSRIRQGAPYDAFLAADTARPKRAIAEGFALPNSRFTYALGTLVLWGPISGLETNGQTFLNAGNFKKIAITNPQTAPYGQAAVETMKSLAVYKSLKPKLVSGSSLSQTLQFITTGNAKVGFVAKSQVISNKEGSFWTIPPKLYSPLTQDAVLLQHGKSNPAAIAFLAFLKDDASKTILKTYGYGWK